VEMPGVEPGSEVNESKPTTRVFDLQGLAVSFWFLDEICMAYFIYFY